MLPRIFVVASMMSVVSVASAQDTGLAPAMEADEVVDTGAHDPGPLDEALDDTGALCSDTGLDLVTRGKPVPPPPGGWTNGNIATCYSGCPGVNPRRLDCQDCCDFCYVSHTKICNGMVGFAKAACLIAAKNALQVCLTPSVCP